MKHQTRQERGIYAASTNSLNSGSEGSCASWGHRPAKRHKCRTPRPSQLHRHGLASSFEAWILRVPWMLIVDAWNLTRRFFFGVREDAAI